MKILLLKNYIHLFEKNKIALVKYWVTNRQVLSILRKHEIEIELFIKRYAIGVIDYYIDVVNGEKEIGDCPTMGELIVFFKSKNITGSELFILCSGFKNSLLEYSYDLKITNMELEREINYIFEENFAGVLELYSKTVDDVRLELTKSSNIIDKYVIMSRTESDGKIVSVSEAFCDISGYSKEELIGQSHNLLKHEDMDPLVYEELWSTISSGKSWHGEIKNLKKDNTHYWIDIIISPILNESNEIDYYDAISQDITSQKELIEQQNILVEQSKSAAMGEMISMIAHQWRQPLQAVSILTQKLPITKSLEGEITDEFLDEVVTGVSTQLDYMSKTIDDFRDFFLPDKPKEKVLIDDVINKALEFVSFMLKTDSISVNLDFKTDRLILVHVNELVQVLINLIKNSRDALNEKEIENKEINLLTYEKYNHIVLEIEDNAGGIDEDIINKIFEPYFSTKNDRNGTGLGLYMCKTIIEKHSKGFLSVKNSSNGAKFQIKLPI